MSGYEYVRLRCVRENPTHAVGQIVAVIDGSEEMREKLGSGVYKVLGPSGSPPPPFAARPAEPAETIQAEAVAASLANAKADPKRYTVGGLREMARAKGLSARGNKAALMKRLGLA